MVLTRIALVLLLVGIGWAARRVGVIEERALGTLSRLVVDLAFPALVLTQLLTTVDAEALAAEWYVPLAAIGILLGGFGLGRLLGSRTAAFCVGLPNWIFLPLLVAEGLYGAPGVRTVLLFNAGAQLALWTVGVATLTGTTDPKALLRNPGLWATGLGVAGALLLPGARALLAAPSEAEGPAIVAALGLEALALFGTMTVPLALVVTGAQLAEVPVVRAVAVDRQLVAVLVGRMALAPLAVWGLLTGAAALGLPVEDRVATLLLVIAAMPVAVSAAVHARRFGGDPDLAARAVLLSTLLSLVTVPLLVALAG